MRKKFLFLLLWFSVVSYAQQRQYRIDWKDSKRVFGEGFSIEVPSFSEDYYSFNFIDGLLFTDQWPSEGIVNPNTVVLKNVVYQNVSEEELIDLDKSKIASELSFTLRNAKSRNEKYTVFQLKPIVKDVSGGYKKVVSFQLNYQFGANLRKQSITAKSYNIKGVSNSVLANGNWYRFYVEASGVYKLSKSFLQNLGVNVNNVDPRTIKLFGHGGDMIPYSNAEPYPYDVPENAIKFVGEEDGVFNNQDYILFYAKGPKGYNAESITHINCYTNRTYYYINVSAGEGKRIRNFSQPTGTPNRILDTFDDYQYYEQDDYNLLSLGRRWFGDKFDIENNKSFEFEFPDLITTEPVRLHVVAASTAKIGTSMAVSVNGQSITNLNFFATSSTNLASGASYNNVINVGSSKISVNLNYNNQGNPSSIAYLDFIAIEGTRALNFNKKQFKFKNKVLATETGIGQYVIGNASNLSEVWDVTDLYNVSNVENTDGDSSFRFQTQMGTVKRFVAVTSLDYYEPKFDSKTKVNNQDIKGTVFTNAQDQFQDVDYIIIARRDMLAQAERLAQINRQQNQLNVKVYTLNDIYTEFSTGNADIGAIRNFVKYVYDNASSSDKRLKYLCLFGDGSFDYKNRLPNNTNIVPSWYSYNSFSLTSSYVSDDFYGMMDDNEGTMASSDMLDLAVGRILAETPQRAREMVDKIESYYAKEAYGSWRNDFVVVSDDVDKDWEGILQETTDYIGNLVTEKKPSMNVVKIHSDSYKQESSAGGDRYPKVTTALSNAVDKGALVVNYFGHGGEDGLASERILLKPDILNFRNVCKLNCFVTVTCEFTRFDNPLRETAGEFTYWNKTTGAIGLITTTRQIFVRFATSFNNILGQYLFAYSDDLINKEDYPSMAEALRLAKADPSVSRETQRRLVFFIGDPAMKLAFAKPNVRLTKINNTPIGQATDTLKALSYVKLAGEVTDASGNLMSNYNGTLSTTIFDKDIDRRTLANDGTRLNGELVVMDFKTPGAVIFRGQASVTNGQFEFDFVVPKDIGVPVGYGKVSFYARNETFTQDQSGANVNIVKIGGVNENAEEDNVGPVMQIYMNDENFVSGGITNQSPTLLVKLEDANGINTASGIGHDIVAIIDGDEKNPIILNDYYQTEVDNYRKGVVSFPLRDIEPGLHTLTVRAWDVYNNSSISEIQFVVYNENQELVIDKVLNYPNPFVNYTEFWFNHNSSESLDVSIQIFTVSGKLVRTLNGQTSGGIKTTSSSLSRDIVWDGRDDFGDKIGKGVYVYKLKVHSNRLDKTVEKIEKLVIL
ncbi:type IX secretion system sortase PorU [Tamlana fucoidanivorans]|uniref:Type IX secretion system sortase PorU n=1 Tax=Allotamlana fucoidanivorans TaxID=2583814 RepID=A0A5C4SKQ9_9FLAO|nr:type IX secretion system sortase PorU [Tamlana fucoidanivorans]TNJ43815.1 type IX secretion system sortase PorU [Tamlana fucoidanivorans]